MPKDIYRSNIKPLLQKVKLHWLLRSIYDQANIGNIIKIHNRKSLRESADSIYQFSAAETVDIEDRSLNLDYNDYHISGNYHLSQPFVAEIHGGRILQGMGVAADSEYRIILDTANSREGRVRDYLWYNQLFAAELARKQFGPRRSCDSYDVDTAVSFVRPMNPLGGSRSKDRYSHWIQGYLTRLQGIEHYIKKTGTQPTFIVEENPPDWLLESLKFYGYGENIKYWDPREEIRVRRLIVPSVRKIEQFNNSGQFDLSYKVISEKASRWLREKSNRILKQTSKDLPSKVFISRSDAGKREIINREEIVRTLRSMGFEVYELTKLTFTEQVNLFSNAEVIIGVHGAGLANSMFARDCTVVEIIGDVFKPTYWLMTKCLGLNYQVISGQSVDNSEHKVIHQDILVDKSKIESLSLN